MSSTSIHTPADSTDLFAAQALSVLQDEATLILEMMHELRADYSDVLLAEITTRASAIPNVSVYNDESGPLCLGYFADIRDMAERLRFDKLAKTAAILNRSLPGTTVVQGALKGSSLADMIRSVVMIQREPWEPDFNLPQAYRDYINNECLGAYLQYLQHSDYYDETECLYSDHGRETALAFGFLKSPEARDTTVDSSAYNLILAAKASIADGIRDYNASPGWAADAKEHGACAIFGRWAQNNHVTYPLPHNHVTYPLPQTPVPSTVSDNIVSSSITAHSQACVNPCSIWFPLSLLLKRIAAEPDLSIEPLIDWFTLTERPLRGLIPYLSDTGADMKLWAGVLGMVDIETAPLMAIDYRSIARFFNLRFSAYADKFGKLDRNLNDPLDADAYIV
jgi:hypothetical protein